MQAAEAPQGAVDVAADRTAERAARRPHGVQAAAVRRAMMRGRVRRVRSVM